MCNNVFIIVKITTIIIITENVTSLFLCYHLNFGPQYDDIAAHRGEQDLNYQRLHVYKNETDSLYSTIPPSQPREQHHIHYTPEYVWNINYTVNEGYIVTIL